MIDKRPRLPPHLWEAPFGDPHLVVEYLLLMAIITAVALSTLWMTS